MTIPRQFPKELPEWLLLVNDKAYLNSRDVAKLFGYKNASSLNDARCVYLTDFPEHDNKVNNGLLWKKKTIVDYIKSKSLP